MTKKAPAACPDNVECLKSRDGKHCFHDDKCCWCAMDKHGPYKPNYPLYYQPITYTVPNMVTYCGTSTMPMTWGNT